MVDIIIEYFVKMNSLRKIKIMLCMMDGSGKKMDHVYIFPSSSQQFGGFLKETGCTTLS